jgi:hypothetical protein
MLFLWYRAYALLVCRGGSNRRRRLPEYRRNSVRLHRSGQRFIWPSSRRMHRGIGPYRQSSTNVRYWRILPVAPTAAFSPFPPLHRAHLKRVLRVDFARSTRRRGMAAICALQPLPPYRARTRAGSDGFLAIRSEEARQGLAAGTDAACASTTFCSVPRWRSACCRCRPRDARQRGCQRPRARMGRTSR